MDHLLGNALERRVALLFSAVVSAVLGAVNSNPSRERERGAVRLLSSWAGTALIAWLVWYSLPRAYLGLGWLLMALPLFEIGLRVRLGEVRAQSYLMAVAGLAALGVMNVIASILIGA